MDVDISCCWCNRPANEVKGFIAPPDLSQSQFYLCTYCVLAAAKHLSGDFKEEAKQETQKPTPNPRQIKAILDDYVIGQEQAKIDIAIAVYNHYKRRTNTQALGTKDIAENHLEIQKSNILLLGSSGTGKTELARTIAKTLDVPIYIGDATRLTSAGYVGDDVESLFQGLIAAADGDVEKAEWGIIFLDEIDKIANPKDTRGYKDVGGEGVQQALLKPLEGSDILVTRSGSTVMGGLAMQDQFSTHNVLFICAGSFAGIEQVVSKRVNKSSRLGFGSNQVGTQNLTKNDIYLQVNEQDLLDFGLIPEFLGRLPVRTSTKELSEEEMVRVLTEPRNAIIKQFQRLFDMDGIQLSFTQEALLEIGKSAKKSPTGARALRGIVEKLLQPISFEAPGSDIESIEVTEKSVLEGEFVIKRGPVEATL